MTPSVRPDTECGMTPPASAAPPGGRRAFTLIEILVSMLIAMIMGAVVIYLFNQTQRSTRTSLAMASLSVSASMVDARVRLDTASLLGPNRTPGQLGGCLVIVPALRLGYVPLPSGRMSRNKVRLRSDQIVFISSRNATTGHPWLSLFPSDQNKTVSMATQPTASSSWDARIWYGGLRDTNGSSTPDDSSNPYWAAHLWSVGRQAKLFVGANAATSPDCTVTGVGDTVAGTLPALKDAAISGSWSAQDYMDKLIGSGIPDSQTNYTNQPASSSKIDLHALEGGQTEQGIQLQADVLQNNLKLFENCSEIIVQWAGDLDKDGQVDTYPGPSETYNSLRPTTTTNFPGSQAWDPTKAITATCFPGHPLAGAIIWYPEELHDKGAAYNGAGKPESRLEGWSATPANETGIAAKYRDIKSTPWRWTFDQASANPGTFATSNSRFGGNHPFPDGFQIDYGDGDHTTTPDPTGSPSVPAPYVFRFEDDQYRLVRYGFRQDGSAYKNQWDGGLIPNPAGGAPVAGLHAFPYPPLAKPPTTYDMNATTGFDPVTAVMYKGKVAPDGPYPRTATDATTVADPTTAGANFGDLMGTLPVPSDAMGTANLKVTGPNGEKYRTEGNGTANDPNQYGQWVKVTYSPNAPGSLAFDFVYPLSTVALSTTVPDTTGAVAPALYSADQITALQGAPVWPYYAGGQPVMMTQAGGKVATCSPAAPPAVPPTPDTPTSRYPLVAQTGSMAQAYGTGNNYTSSYTDLYAEYLRTINGPKAGTIEDWRMPQTDWPRLIRIRVRLHDPQGLVSSYSDEFLLNGRDNDGDGKVNNPEEGRMSGMWFEYVFAIPVSTDPTHPGYPMDPNPRSH